MRLISTTTLEFEEFIGRPPRYAILSHTWESGQEVSFKEFRKHATSTKAKSGYRKILEAAKLAKGDALDWIWIDSCCRFYGSDWGYLFDRRESASLLSSITGIATNALEHFRFSSFSVAECMTWASKRETTREEDLAYCLFGLFDVAMPLLYGEGLRSALHRLQERIIQKSDDQTIFLWNPGWRYNLHIGVLAPRPRDFAQAACWRPESAGQLTHSYSMTNKGLSGVFYICRGPGLVNHFLMMLECTDGQQNRPIISIVQTGSAFNHFARARESVRTLSADRIVMTLKWDLLNSWPLPEVHDDPELWEPGAPFGAARMPYEFHARSLFVHHLD